eukprot:TRINITY_DN57608_c0_g1_i1.p2 TRINITY_DN57608_c0_g1~~TRINITY_DN57608_c0_g1_i1.p2  ORF type:complete len:161 (+),score=25.28 TRINITY_DN57608_c0_g1_i1:81-563(+)
MAVPVPPELPFWPAEDPASSPRSAGGPQGLGCARAAASGPPVAPGLLPPELPALDGSPPDFPPAATVTRPAVREAVLLPPELPALPDVDREQPDTLFGALPHRRPAAPAGGVPLRRREDVDINDLRWELVRLAWSTDTSAELIRRMVAVAVEAGASNKDA